MISNVVRTSMIDDVPANKEAIRNVHLYLTYQKKYKEAHSMDGFDSYSGHMKGFESDLGSAAFCIQSALSELQEDDLAREASGNDISESVLLDYVRVASGLKKQVSFLKPEDLSGVDYKLSKLRLSIPQKESQASFSGSTALEELNETTRNRDRWGQEEETWRKRTNDRIDRQCKKERRRFIKQQKKSEQENAQLLEKISKDIELWKKRCQQKSESTAPPS